jgi:hypothetical protein
MVTDLSRVVELAASGFPVPSSLPHPGFLPHLEGHAVGKAPGFHGRWDVHGENFQSGPEKWPDVRLEGQLERCRALDVARGAGWVRGTGVELLEVASRTLDNLAAFGAGRRA